MVPFDVKTITLSSEPHQCIYISGESIYEIYISTIRSLFILPPLVKVVLY